MSEDESLLKTLPPGSAPEGEGAGGVLADRYRLLRVLGRPPGQPATG